jgi:hypothetical protein
MDTNVVFNSESSNFVKGQGSQGIVRRRTAVQPTSKAVD